MRIAIVGGTGALGRHLAAELGSRGHEIRVLSRTTTEYRVDLVTAARRIARGPDEVVRWLLGFMRQPPTLVRIASVNGGPGLIVRDGGGVLNVVAFTIDRGRITALDVVRNPDKLAAPPRAG